MIQKLARLLFPYGRVRRVWRGPVKGQKFEVGSGIGVSYALGTATAAPRYFSDYVKPGMTVYDLGGNKGQMALLFAALVGSTGKVVTFEPVPAECAALKRNIALNRLSHVFVVPAAVAATRGEQIFRYAEDQPSQGKLRDVETDYQVAGASEFSVKTVTLDDMIKEYGVPDVLKIDVEGGAASALKGAAQLLSKYHPAIFIELHGPEEQAGVKDFLISRGYQAFTLAGSLVEDPANGWYSPLWCIKPAHD